MYTSKVCVVISQEELLLKMLLCFSVFLYLFVALSSLRVTELGGGGEKKHKRASNQMQVIMDNWGLEADMLCLQSPPAFLSFNLSRGDLILSITAIFFLSVARSSIISPLISEPPSRIPVNVHFCEQNAPFLQNKQKPKTCSHIRKRYWLLYIDSLALRWFKFIWINKILWFYLLRLA